MAAIRCERNEVAEYLIDQLAVNVEYAADLHEFRVNSKVPLRYQKYSCRDLAYQKGMMTLVDLIDLASEDVKPSTKQLIKQRLQSRLDVIHRNYLQRMKRSQRPQPKFLPPVLFTPDNIPKPANAMYTSRSHIDELLERIRPNEEKSIEETGEKKFRFSNYTLHFRLVDPSKNTRSMVNESPRSKPTIPSHSSTALTSVSLPSFTAPITTHPRSTISQHGRRLPVRDTRTSIARLNYTRANTTILAKTNPIQAFESTKNCLEKQQHERYNSHRHQSSVNSLHHAFRRPVLVTLKPKGIGLSVHPEEIKN